MSAVFAGEGEDDLWAYEFTHVSTASSSAQSATPRPSHLASSSSSYQIQTPKPVAELASPSLETAARAGLSGGFFKMHVEPEGISPVEVTRSTWTQTHLGPARTSSIHLDSATQPIAATQVRLKLKTDADVDKGKTAWGEALILVDELAAEHKKLKIAYTHLHSERATLITKLSTVQTQLDKSVQLKTTYESRLRSSGELVKQLRAEMAGKGGELEVTVAKERAASKARERQLLQQINDIESSKVSCPFSWIHVVI